MAGRRFPKLFEMFDLEKEKKKETSLIRVFLTRSDSCDPQKEMRRRRRRKLGVFTAEISS